MTDAELAAAVAPAVVAALGYPPGTTPTDRVDTAAAAAVLICRRYLYGDIPVTPPPVLPDPATGPDLYAGLVAFAVRIYHDPASPGGVVGADAYTGAALPEDLLAHVRHYFEPYRQAWGFA